MTRTLLITIIILVLSPHVHARKTTVLDSLLVELDRTLQNDKYRQQKESDIALFKYQFNNPGFTVEDEYRMLSKLTAEYEFYRCDSARVYALQLLQAAQKTGDYRLVNDSKIQLASVLFKAAMFDQAVELLDSVDESQLSDWQRFEYYKAYYETYVSWVEFYANGYEDPALDAKRDHYYEEFLKTIPEDTYEYASYFGIKYIITDQFDKAEELLYDYLPKARIGTRDYSILTSVLSFLYQRKGNMEKVKEYLALSAISDIRGAVMENSSLRQLAEYLFDEGDINRANTYIKRSMEEANFYNARIRNIKISRVLPIIDKAYQTDKARQQRQLLQLLVVISILSVVLLVAIFFIVRQIRKVSLAKKEISKINEKLQSKNQALAETNLALAETNHIKEEYIGHFMGLCSVYIEKMEKYQRRLFNKAKTSTAEELYKTIKSTQFIKDEREEFYNNFDDSFLKLFPNFVEEFNTLLPEDERIVLKVNEKLTTELRIFALIRLGINDSNKIAEFLDYSLATIYNYRSRFRNKALVPRNEFENEVMKIGSRSLN